jgi:C4-dicarboxylate transporter DctQ subunit
MNGSTEGLFVKLLRGVSSCGSTAAKFCIVTMMSLVGIDVFCRYVLNEPLLWIDEINGFLVVAVGFLGAAETLRQEKHINIEVITDRLKPRQELWLKMVTSMISTVFLSIFCVHCTVMVYLSFVRGVTTPSVLLSPLWIPQTVMLIGAVMLTLQMAISTKERFKAILNTKGGGNGITLVEGTKQGGFCND